MHNISDKNGFDLFIHIWHSLEKVLLTMLLENLVGLVRTGRKFSEFLRYGHFFTQ